MSAIATSNWPKMTVVVATYNNKSTVQQCIDSVAQQTYPHKELIIIDGGSHDGTVDLLKASEQMALMAGSLAVINPSLFEGWSTTVEEAKSMGKVVLLSDIPVHREQAPLRGRYFQPDRAEDLAILMAEALAGYDQVVDQENMLAAQEAVPARLERFAQEYEEIVLEQIV